MRQNTKNRKNKKKSEIKEMAKILKKDEKLRYFGIILENVDKNMKMVLEGVAGLDAKFTKEINNLKEEIRIINLKLDAQGEILKSHSQMLEEHSRILNEHSRILNEHSKILDEHTKILDQLQKDVAIMKMDIIWLKNEVKKKPDFEDFIKLERRVALLEKKINR